MTERIKELKHKASVWCDQNIPEQFSEETNGYGKAWEDKFAELIVRECAGIVQPYMSRWEEDCDLVIKIKQHFGVEQ